MCDDAPRLPLGMVIFQPPAGWPEDQIPRLGIELQSWHLSTLPLIIEQSAPLPLSAGEMERLRHELIEHRHPTRPRRLDERIYWGEADDVHCGQVVVFLVVPKSLSDKRLQEILDRNQIRPIFSKRRL
jgi:hypothetical protein